MNKNFLIIIVVILSLFLFVALLLVKSKLDNQSLVFISRVAYFLAFLVLLTAIVFFLTNGKKGYKYQTKFVLSLVGSFFVLSLLFLIIYNLLLKPLIK